MSLCAGYRLGRVDLKHRATLNPARLIRCQDNQRTGRSNIKRRKGRLAYSIHMSMAMCIPTPSSKVID